MQRAIRPISAMAAVGAPVGTGEASQWLTRCAAGSRPFTASVRSAATAKRGCARAQAAHGVRALEPIAWQTGGLGVATLSL